MKYLALLEKCGSKQAKPITTINRTERDQAKSSTDLLIVLWVQFYQRMLVLSILNCPNMTISLFPEAISIFN